MVQRRIKNDLVTTERNISTALTAGYYMNTAARCANESVYKLLPISTKGPKEVTLVYIHPNSTFIQHKGPEYVIYQSLIHSSKLYMNNIARIDYACFRRHQNLWEDVSVNRLSGRDIVEETVSNDKVTNASTSKSNTNVSIKREREDSRDLQGDDDDVSKTKLRKLEKSETVEVSTAAATNVNVTVSSVASKKQLTAVELARQRYLERKGK